MDQVRQLIEEISELIKERQALGKFLDDMVAMGESFLKAMAFPQLVQDMISNPGANSQRAIEAWQYWNENSLKAIFERVQHMFCNDSSLSLKQMIIKSNSGFIEKFFTSIASFERFFEHGATLGGNLEEVQNLSPKQIKSMLSQVPSSEASQVEHLLYEIVVNLFEDNMHCRILQKKGAGKKRDYTLFVGMLDKRNDDTRGNIRIIQKGGACPSVSTQDYFVLGPLASWKPFIQDSTAIVWKGKWGDMLKKIKQTTTLIAQDSDGRRFDYFYQVVDVLYHWFTRHGMVVDWDILNPGTTGSMRVWSVKKIKK